MEVTFSALFSGHKNGSNRVHDLKNLVQIVYIYIFFNLYIYIPIPWIPSRLSLSVLQVSCFDDGSSDGSAKILERWQERLCRAFPEPWVESKNFPTYPWNIPQTPNQRFMFWNSFHLGGLWILGVCSKGMLGFS